MASQGPADELAVVHSLANRLAAKRVPWAHWKSNEHLDAAVAGQTDLDVLVAEDQIDSFRAVLDELGFLVVGRNRSDRPPGVWDAIGMDPDTTRLVHLHVHERLAVGSRYSKNVRIPWESEVLEGAQPGLAGVPVVRPEAELTTLVVRILLKGAIPGISWTRSRRRILHDAERERAFLISSCPSGAIKAWAARVLPEDAADAVEAAARAWTTADFHRLRNALRRARLSWYRPGPATWARRLVQWTVWNARRVARRIGASGPHRARPPGGGVIIALTGIDGSGKSTQVERLRAWFAWKFDVANAYLGTSGGSSRRSSTGREDRRKWVRGRLRNMLSGRADLIRRPWRARRRMRAWRRAMRARNRGYVVVSDRWPQPWVAGLNDGPLYEPNARGWMARRDRKWLQQVVEEPPNVVIHLDLSPEVAAGRRPQDNPGVLRRKHAAFEHIHEQRPPQCVDASRSPDEVTRAIRRAVWDALEARR